MTFEIIMNVVDLIITCLSPILVVFGWIVPYKHNKELELNRQTEELNAQKRIWQMEYIDKQISEFYGPISALLKEEELIFQNILFMLGRKCVFTNDAPNLDDLPDNERKIWIHYVNTYKLPTGRKIIEIIQHNKHLVYNGEIPECFNRFLDYTLGWELLDNQMRNGVPNYYEYHYSYNFPSEFTAYINSTLHSLLLQKRNLINENNCNTSSPLDSHTPN